VTLSGTKAREEEKRTGGLSTSGMSDDDDDLMILDTVHKIVLWKRVGKVRLRGERDMRL